MKLLHKKLFIIDKNAPVQAFETIINNGGYLIPSQEIKTIKSSVSSHPDMQLLKLSNKKIIVEPTVFSYYSKKLQKFNINVICGHKYLNGKYPDDIAYNAVYMGNTIFHYKEKSEFYNADINFINVKQGYTKCSTCIISDKAVITSDNGLHKKFSETGIDSLLITPGNIELKGFNYGFFGGCTGMINKNTLAICGNLKLHPDYKKINDFLNKYNIKIMEIYQGKLTDIGTIICFDI